MATMNLTKRNLNLQFTTLRLSPIPVPPEVITSSRSIMMTHNDVAVPYARNFITYIVCTLVIAHKLRKLMKLTCFSSANNLAAAAHLPRKTESQRRHLSVANRTRRNTTEAHTTLPSD